MCPAHSESREREGGRERDSSFPGALPLGGRQRAQAESRAAALLGGCPTVLRWSLEGALCFAKVGSGSRFQMPDGVERISWNGGWGWREVVRKMKRCAYPLP